MEIERKSFTGVELKTDKPGSFIARIATLNVIDKDGDVTIPGAFPEGKEILISAYQHGSWQGNLPVGKGTIHESGNDVLVNGEFNLNSNTGKEHYETIKFAPKLSEWSYGFEILKKETDTEWNGQKVSRILKSVNPFEASPVLRGAGMETATLAIKSESEQKSVLPYKDLGKAAEGEAWDAAKEVAAASVDDLKLMCTWVDSAHKEDKTAYKLPHHKAGSGHSAVWKGVTAAMGALLGARGGVDIPAADKKAVYNHLSKHYAEFEKEVPEFREDSEGISYAEQSEMALATVKEWKERTKALATLRLKESRILSAANRDRIKNMADQLHGVHQDMCGLLDETDPNKGVSETAQKLFLEFSKINQEIMLMEVN